MHYKNPGVPCIWVCFFVWLGFIVQSRISLIWRRHYYLWRAAHFDLEWLAFMVIEQWVFFSMPHLLWHGESVYNGQLHLLLSVEQRGCLYMFLRLRSFVAEIRTPNLPLAGPTLCLSDTSSTLVFPYLGNITHKFLIKWTSIDLQEFLHIIVKFCCAFWYT